MRFKGLTSFNETLMLFLFYVHCQLLTLSRLDLKSSRGISCISVAFLIVTQKMIGYCVGLRAVGLFVNRSAMFVEGVY